MSLNNQDQITFVDASPVKSFFVSMLTRDISLEESILDLLDNCVDGILRIKHDESNKPYEGFWAKITFNKDSFLIADNCGGIPKSLIEYAFRMGRAPGRPEDPESGVGVYGIGMKRAIFKMGKRSLISTQNGPDNHVVDIQPDWLAREGDWHIPTNWAPAHLPEDGTTILIENLYDGISARFSDDAEAFKSELERMISTHYSFIIDKGFKVTINDDVVNTRTTRLIFAPKEKRRAATAIQPFMYKAKTDDDVEVFISVGFTRPIPSEDEIFSSQDETQYSSIDAGWTIICNDRAVLYCDRTELTGWGEAGIPRYHTQFISISGIVEFRSADAAKLPTTTTKRGVDASSILYLQAKNKMREGMKLFTDYTNRWKGQAEESRKHMDQGRPLSLTQLKTEAESLQFSATARPINDAQQYRPALPRPERSEPRWRRISFNKDIDEIGTVKEHLFDEADVNPSTVGQKCFEIILKEALT